MNFLKMTKFVKILELNPEGRQRSKRQRRVLRTIAFAQLRAEDTRNDALSPPGKTQKDEKLNSLKFSKYTFSNWSLQISKDSEELYC